MPLRCSMKSAAAMQNESRPQVLVLGNGILRAFEGAAGSCQDLENQLMKAAGVASPEGTGAPTIPFPLRVAASFAKTDEHHVTLQKAVASLCVAKKDKGIWCNLGAAGCDYFKQLLACGFTDIITTNYGYEIEKALCGKCPGPGEKRTNNFYKRRIFPKKLGITERKFKIWKYYQFRPEGPRIWHVHGEFLKPQSIILEYSDYCSLLAVVKKYPHPKCQEPPSDAPKSRPWIQEFLDGDVYILGFGAALCEPSFWYLMERKCHRKNTGKVCFYEPNFGDADNEQKDRLAMFSAFGADYQSLGMTILKANEKDFKANEGDFETFYQKTAEDIIKRVQSSKTAAR